MSLERNCQSINISHGCTGPPLPGWKRTEELERVDKTLATAVRALRARAEQWVKEAE
jgi:hypothetical protein